jgi:FlaA1/EpsC-like NDP-sugar epimerase
LSGAYGASSKELFSSNKLLIVLICIGCWFLCARPMGLYKDFRAIPFSYEWIVFLKTLLIYSLVISFIFFQILKNYSFEKPHLILHCALVFILLPSGKVIIRMVLKKIRNSSQIKRKVLIVGVRGLRA